MSTPLTTLEERAVDTFTRSIGLLTPIGVTAVPVGPVGFSTATTDWVVVAAEDDPHLAGGLFVVPRPVLDRLGSLDRLDVKLDRLFVAHELPAGTLSRTGGRLEKNQLESVIPKGSPDPALCRTLDTCNRLVGAAAASVVAPFAALGKGAAAIAQAMEAGLDPALMAVVTASGRATPGELGAWFLIAAWV